MQKFHILYTYRGCNTIANHMQFMKCWNMFSSFRKLHHRADSRMHLPWCCCILCIARYFMLKRLSLQLWTIFEKFYFLFKSFVKAELSFHKKSVHYSWKLHGKVNYLIKQVCFLLLVIICVPPIIIDSQSFKIDAVVLILIICKDLRNW